MFLSEILLTILVGIEDNRLGFYFIFSYFLLKEYKTKKTKCDTVTEVTCSHDTEGCRRF